MTCKLDRRWFGILPVLVGVTSMTIITSCSRKDDDLAASSQYSSDYETTADSNRRTPLDNEDPMPSKVVTQDKSSLDNTNEVDEAAYSQLRNRMVTQQLSARDITDERVLLAMSRVPRHRFVSPREQHLAYADSPLPIGHGQTISQPYIVALMTQLVDPQPTAKALDIGTGSGFQAAVLAELVKSVHSIEIVEALAQEADTRLQSLGYKNVHVRHGDGYRGWPEEAPFDIIIVAAAPDHIPRPLVEQLAPGGKMVIPVGKFYQKLLLIEKSKDGTVTQRKVAPVAFVPMTGEAQD